MSGQMHGTGLGNARQTNIRLHPHLREGLIAHAAHTGRSINAIANEAVETYLRILAQEFADQTGVAGAGEPA